MPVNQAWIDEVRAMDRLPELEHIEVDGVRLELPVGGRRKGNTWQRRVSDDVLPDSPNADAPEKTPSQILHSLTEPQKCDRTLAEVLGGELAPLAPLFLFETRGKRAIPVAFHVLATKAAGSPIQSRSFTAASFLLLMRDEEGRLDEPLLHDFVEAFRARPESLDLAQQTVLEQLHPNWDPAVHHGLVDQKTHGPAPFAPEAGVLLRRDLRRLLDAKLSRADFFRYVNRLLALHFGLYQPRLAALLNPAMRELEREAEAPDSGDLDAAVAIERGEHPRHAFEGSILTQAPTGAEWRPMKSDSPALHAYKRVGRALNELHFSLMVLNRVRDVSAAWLIQKRHYEADAAYDAGRRPSDIMRKLRQDPDFRRYFEAAFEAFCVRFIKDQIADTSTEAALEDVRAAPSGVSGLFELYRRYNREASTRASNTRSVKQGEAVVRRLLGTGESGLLRTRRGVGAYFEIGAGLLPLVLLSTVPTGADKIAVHRFWPELARYGVYLEPSERERLLLRLKAMGLYERYSDAGTASYVRSILAPSAEVA